MIFQFCGKKIWAQGRLLPGLSLSPKPIYHRPVCTQPELDNLYWLSNKKIKIGNKKQKTNFVALGRQEKQYEPILRSTIGSKLIESIHHHILYNFPNSQLGHPVHRILTSLKLGHADHADSNSSYSTIVKIWKWKYKWIWHPLIWIHLPNSCVTSLQSQIHKTNFIDPNVNMQ